MPLPSQEINTEIEKENLKMAKMKKDQKEEGEGEGDEEDGELSSLTSLMAKEGIQKQCIFSFFILFIGLSIVVFFLAPT
jgi:hypothetical protein